MRRPPSPASSRCRWRAHRYGPRADLAQPRLVVEKRDAGGDGDRQPRPGHRATGIALYPARPRWWPPSTLWSPARCRRPADFAAGADSSAPMPQRFSAFSTTRQRSRRDVSRSPSCPGDDDAGQGVVEAGRCDARLGPDRVEHDAPEFTVAGEAAHLDPRAAIAAPAVPAQRLAGMLAGGQLGAFAQWDRGDFDAGPG